MQINRILYFRLNSIHSLMKMRLIILPALLLIAAACAERRTIDGTVYSKHDIPLSGVKVVFGEYKTSSYPEVFQSTLTDQNGHYSFVWRIRRNRSYAVEARSDSGYCKSTQYYKKKIPNTVDLTLR
jgi:hypothetical protein